MHRLKAVTYEVPKKLHPPKDPDAITPKAIRRWVKELPVGHRGETTKKLYRTLKELNTVTMPVGDRFEVMQTLAAPVDATVAALQHHLESRQFPLSDRSVMIAELVNEMLASMVIGYRLILNDGRDKNWLYRRVNEQMWIVSLYRLLRYFERILSGYRLLNMPYPKGLWRAIHRLYLQTTRVDWHDDTISREDGAPVKTTIEREYKKALLLSLLSRHQIRGDQFDEVEELLEYWVGFVELRRPIPASEERVSFCIPENADTPPMAMHAACKRECGGSRDGRVLDTHGLKSELMRILAHDSDQFVIKGHRIQRDTLELVCESWCKPHVREEERKSGNGEQVQVALGISYIHRLLTAQGAGDGMVSPNEEPDAVALESLKSALEPFFEKDEIESEKAESGIEIWNIVYENPEFHRLAWSAKDISREYHVADADVVNYSKHGYCLRVEPCEDEKVRNGDVVGIHDDKRNFWHLGQVKWLKAETERRIVMGVQMLVEAAFPVGLRVVLSDNRHSEVVPALVGVDDKNELLLVMPYLPAVKRKQFVLDYHGHLARIRLTKRIAISPSFIAYYMVEGEGTIADTIDELTVPAHAVQQLEKPTPPDELLPDDEDEVRKAAQDKYADLWDKL